MEMLEMQDEMNLKIRLNQRLKPSAVSSIMTIVASMNHLTQNTCKEKFFSHFTINHRTSCCH